MSLIFKDAEVLCTDVRNPLKDAYSKADRPRASTPSLNLCNYKQPFLLQLYGYLSRRGNMAGVLSLYHWTWLTVADGQGTLKIAEPVRCTAVGSESTLSVVEVNFSCPAYVAAEVGVYRAQSSSPIASK